MPTKQTEPAPLSEEVKDFIESLTPQLAELERGIRWTKEILITEATLEHALPDTLQMRRIVPTTSPMGKRRNCLAWYWKDKWSTKEGELLDELTFVAEHLRESPVNVIATCIHEMVHAWCKSMDLKDTAKSGRHNKVFKKYAEYLGLIVKDPFNWLGYAYTHPSPELAKRIEQEFQPDHTLLNLFRNEDPPRAKREGKDWRKWHCGSDSCDPIYTKGKIETLTVVSTCLLCGNTFEEVTSK